MKTCCLYMVLPLFLVAFLAGCGTDETLPETGMRKASRLPVSIVPSAAYLADKVRQSAYAGTGFYIWAASGTSDSAYSEILLQIEGMARLPEVFHTGNMTFHEKEGARHEYRPTMEYIYNALPFFFPKNDE